MSLSDSALSQRRENPGVEPFASVVAHALRPLAEADRHGGCFFKKLRLLGIDGTRWSLLNTPRNNVTAPVQVAPDGHHR